MPLNYSIIVGKERLDIKRHEVTAGELSLNMRKGELTAEYVIAHNRRRTKIIEKRILHLKQKSLAVQTVEIIPLNYGDNITIRYSLDNSAAFTTVQGKKIFHLKTVSAAYDASGILLESKTTHSGIKICQYGILHAAKSSGIKERTETESNKVVREYSVSLEPGKPFSFDIVCSTINSVDVNAVKKEACSSVRQAMQKGMPALRREHYREWEKAWKRADVMIQGDDRALQLSRYNIFNLVGLSPYKSGISIGAKGLHGEGYRGHIFWDTEIYLLPFYAYTDPPAAENLLHYRLNRLKPAKRYARELGYKGARFPWESADNGTDVTPKEGDTAKQEHIIADIVYAVNMFIQITDKKYLINKCTPLIVECARYYASRVEFDKKTEQYVISDAIGPDEFHQGISNNFYTNYMVKHVFDRAARLTRNPREAAMFRNRVEHMRLPYDKDRGFHEQFDGYFNRADMPMRIDASGNRILSKALMGIYNSPEAVKIFGDTKLIKQADAVMLYSLFYSDFEKDCIRKAYSYYEPRTTHGSSLSRAPYAIIASRLQKSAAAYRDFLRSAELDLKDLKNSAGIHAASLGGAWQILVFGFGGIHLHNGKLHMDPCLPKHWKKLAFTINFLHSHVACTISANTLYLKKNEKQKITVVINGQEHIFAQTLIINLKQNVSQEGI
jgi:kojibiose phosphorylase